MNLAAFRLFKDASAGFEFNMEKNNKYKKNIIDRLFSLRIIPVKQIVEIFGRYDYLTSNKLTGTGSLEHIR